MLKYCFLEGNRRNSFELAVNIHWGNYEYCIIYSISLYGKRWSRTQRY